VIRLADLEGQWQLSRIITDRRRGIVGRLEGQVIWRPDAAGLRQEESGLLHFGDAPPMQASRTYLWRASPAGAGLDVFFEDGRAFHRLSPGQTTDTHHCDPDIYHVSYDFSAWPQWEQRWEVHGPRKDTTLVSRFMRDPQ